MHPCLPYLLGVRWTTVISTSINRKFTTGILTNIPKRLIMFATTVVAWVQIKVNEDDEDVGYFNLEVLIYLAYNHMYAYWDYNR